MKRRDFAWLLGVGTAGGLAGVRPAPARLFPEPVTETGPTDLVAPNPWRLPAARTHVTAEGKLAFVQDRFAGPLDVRLRGPTGLQVGRTLRVVARTEGDWMSRDGASAHITPSELKWPGMAEEAARVEMGQYGEVWLYSELDLSVLGDLTVIWPDVVASFT